MKTPSPAVFRSISFTIYSFQFPAVKTTEKWYLLFAFALFKTRFHKNNGNKIEYLAGNKVFVIPSILFHKIQLKMLLCHICTCRSLHYNLRSSGCSLQRSHLFYCTHSMYSSRTANFAPKPFNVLLRKSFYWVQPLFHNFGSPAAHFGLKKGCHSF